MTDHPLRVGYLVSQFPAPSHTFIRREVEAVRAQGLNVRTYSVRPGITIGAGEAEPTFALLAQPKLAFVAAQFWAMRRPGRWLSTLLLALRHRTPGLKALVWSLFHFAEAVLLARQLRRDGIGRLHNHFANAGGTVGMLAAHLTGLPWSLTLHGISEFDHPAGLLLPAKLERSEFAACVSWFGMAQAMRLTRPAIWPRLRLVRCGIDPAALPSPEPRDDDAVLRLICVGRLSPEKGQAGLIRVVHDLQGEGLPIHLTLVGDGPDGPMLRALVAELGAEAIVTFTGALAERETLAAIARADALVLTSFMEGLPIVLMEALALGKPVVASRVAGIPELVEDGVNGLLFDPAHWAELGAALRRMADPALRATLARGAPDRVREEFSYPAAAAPLLALFTPS